jgi:hypothetical protein
MTTHLTRSGAITTDSAQQAFGLLRTVFTMAPIVFGLAVRHAPARRAGVGS